VLTSKASWASKLAWNFASLAIVGGSGIVANVALGWLYGAAAIGSFNQVFALFLIAGQIGALGIHLSAQKYLSEFLHDPCMRADCLGGALALIAGVGLGVTVAYLAAAPIVGALLGSEDVRRGIWLSGAGLWFFVLNKLLFSALNGLDLLRAYAVLQALRPVVLVCAIVAVARNGSPASELPLALTLSEGLVCVAGWLSLGLKELTRVKWVAARQWMARHGAFGLKGSLSNILLELNARVDILILGLFMNDMMVGIYSFSAILVEGFAQLPIVVRTVVHAKAVRLLADRDFSTLRTLAKRVAKRVYAGMAVLCIVAVAVFPFATPWVSQTIDVWVAWEVFVILMLGIFLSSGYIPMSNILLQGGLPGCHSLIISLLVLINIVGNVCLIPLWGLYGAAIATAFSFALMPPFIIVGARLFLEIELW
jgi:O-antigen/teichoic acid export membrane protein